jgi:membrane protease YdiL (CAAX protease family)
MELTVLSTVTRIYKSLQRLTAVPGINAPRPLIDSIAFLSAFSLLFSASGAVAFFAYYFPEYFEVVIEKPSTFYGWLEITITLLLAGYVEEGIFRYLLPNILRNLGARPLSGALFSQTFFAFFHQYEGVYGVIYAGIAGLLLLWVLRRTGSLHGTALAHAAYNILVYFFA